MPGRHTGQARRPAGRAGAGGEPDRTDHHAGRDRSQAWSWSPGPAAWVAGPGLPTTMSA